MYSNNWELLKYEIAKYLRKYSSDLAKRRRAEENGTILKITSLTSKPVDVLTESEKIELIDQQHRLDEIYKHKAEGAFVRSRRRWVEEGERNSAYFFRLERQQSKNNSIQQLRIDGSVTNDSKKIANYCAEFCSNLYTYNYCHQSKVTYVTAVEWILDDRQRQGFNTEYLLHAHAQVEY